ncbi:MAG TPA: formate dehydrogenase subunit gamma [Thermohalobaculum sp.]|nr:formate dehydrogenase subunit gamma [Thermohalobaculum sp.]
MSHRRRGNLVGFLALCLAILVFSGSAVQFALTLDAAWAQSSVRPPENVVIPAQPGESRPLDMVEPFPSDSDRLVGPLGPLGPNSDATLWGAVRHGERFSVSIPDEKAAILVQSGGVEWQRMRAGKGPLGEWGANAIAVTVLVLAIFYVVRGRIRVEHGFSGRLIERFNGIERFGHWLLAVSFILLALTGLNLIYGREYLLPLIGRELFATVAAGGKWVHNNVAWAFMLGLVMVFVMWVGHNLPRRADLVWILKGGGMFRKGVHPPAWKFNAGQKLVFWAVILLGTSVSMSGVSLLFPFELPLFAKTFEVMNALGVAVVWGAPLPTELTPFQEMQLAQLWHAIVALAMTVVIIAHIYIGTLGMEGAFDAMGSGQVDLNWAKEHHSLWVEQEEARGRVDAGSRDSATTPAE